MRHGEDVSPAVIDRIAGLLDEFRDGRELTLSQLSCRTGLPRSTAHRLLAQLVDSGWVRRRGHAYALSRTVFEWGALAQRNNRLYQAAHPVLHELHATTGLTVHLAVLDGNEVLYLDKVGPGRDILPSRVGGRRPALRTALGKAIIAHPGLSGPCGSATRASLRAVGSDTRLRHELARVRQSHVAHDREESVPGVACVAAPISDSRVCVGAVSVTGPVGGVDSVTLAMPVRSAAHAIWQALAAGDPVRQAG